MYKDHGKMRVALLLESRRAPKAMKAAGGFGKQVLRCWGTASVVVVHNMSGHHMNTQGLKRGLPVGGSLR